MAIVMFLDTQNLKYDSVEKGNNIFYALCQNFSLLNYFWLTSTWLYKTAEVIPEQL